MAEASGGSEFKYDVAVSFLKQDEPLALELDDLLKARLKTFVYSRRQEDLAGTDGEKIFGNVFGREARLVVILYRRGWGETPWTRIEENAIRNRGHEQGYEFVKLVHIDEPAPVPRWLPRSTIWLGLNRLGVAGAAAVLEQRAGELGSELREETIAERAARMAQAAEFERRRANFQRSGEGVTSGNAEFELLAAETRRLVEEARAAAPSEPLTFKAAPSHLVVLGQRVSISVIWVVRVGNSLEEAFLRAELWIGHAPFFGVLQVTKPKSLGHEDYRLDLARGEQRVWVPVNDPSKSVPSVLLAKQILTRLMDRIPQEAGRPIADYFQD